MRGDTNFHLQAEGKPNPLRHYDYVVILAIDFGKRSERHYIFYTQNDNDMMIINIYIALRFITRT